MISVVTGVSFTAVLEGAFRYVYKSKIQSKHLDSFSAPKTLLMVNCKWSCLVFVDAYIYIFVSDCLEGPVVFSLLWVVTLLALL